MVKKYLLTKSLKSKSTIIEDLSTQPDETNDFLHQELCSMTCDIIDKDILLIKSEFENFIIFDENIV